MSTESEPAIELWGRVHAVALLLAASCSLAIHSALPVAWAGTASLLFLVWLHRGRFTPSGAFGVANTVTLLRLCLTAGLAVLGRSPPGPPSALLALFIFALDGVDGWLARRNDQASAFGGRLDMECDALLVLSCTLVLYLHNRLGAFILLPGVLRYLYVLGLGLGPARADEAPRSRVGRHAFSVMMLSLVASLWPLEPWHRPLAVLATLLIVYSFGRSVYWSHRPA